MHNLVHYNHFIKKFEILISLDIDIDEQSHINHLKRSFQRINKRRNFETQTFRHDTRRLNVLAIKNMKRYIKNRQQNENEIDETLKINRITKAKDIENLKWSRSKVELQHLRRHKCNFKNWCWASIAAREVDVSDMLQILIVFIRQKRAKKRMIDSIENVFTKVIRKLNYTLKNNINWMTQCFVQVHKNLKMWNKLRKNFKDMHHLIEEISRCTFDWQKMSERRCDFIWIQEHESDNLMRSDESYSWNERMMSRLNLILTIKDSRNFRDNFDSTKYIETLISLLRMRNKAQINSIHDMMKVKKWHQTIEINRRFLKNRRFYVLSSLIRNAHVISRTKNIDDIDYINNMIDWNQFQKLYDKDYMNNDMKFAKQYKTTTKRNQSMSSIIKKTKMTQKKRLYQQMKENSEIV